MKRRIISMALAAALSIGCIPVSAAELDIEQMLAEAAENIPWETDDIYGGERYVPETQNPVMSETEGITDHDLLPEPTETTMDVEYDVVFPEEEISIDTNPPYLQADPLDQVNMFGQTREAAVSDMWNAAFSKAYGDSYGNPMNAGKEGQSVSGDTNRLVIQETDLTLQGKNGLDLSITRRHDNQEYNNMYTPSGYVSQQTKLILYEYYVDDTDETIYISFQSHDQMYIYMHDDFYVTDLNRDRGEVGESTNGRVFYYDFGYILSHMDNEEGDIKLSLNEERGEVTGYEKTNNDVLRMSSHVLFSNNDNIGQGWKLVLPAVSMYVTTIENDSYDDGFEFLKRVYVCSFRDKNGNVSMFSGEDTIEREDGETSYSEFFERADNGSNAEYHMFYGSAKYYGDTGRRYNMTVEDSDGLTYYFYLPDHDKADLGDIRGGRDYRSNIIAVEDEYGNCIQYFQEDSSDVSRVNKIIDTYGREVDLNKNGNVFTVSYTDDGGEEQEIKYTSETLSTSELNNGSILDHKDIKRLTVTDQLGESTVYDGREGEAVNFYMGGNPHNDMNEVQVSNGEYVTIETQTNIERITYPSGAETMYSYVPVNVFNADTHLNNEVYAVKTSYDVVDGVKENERSYTFENDGSDSITKRETNAGTGAEITSLYNSDHKLESEQTRESGSSVLKGQVSYRYDENGYIERETVDRGIYDYTIDYTRDDEGKVKTEKHGSRVREYTYYDRDTIAGIVTTYEDENGKSRKYIYETTKTADANDVEYERMIEDKVVKTQNKYEYDDEGNVTAVKQWINDTNGDGVLDENDEYITATGEYGETEQKTLSAVTGTADILNADGVNEGDISEEYEFNIYGSPVYAKDSYGTVSSIEYDALNRPVKYNYPNGSSVTVEYNTDEMYTLASYPDGTKKKYNYDGLGRVSKVQTGYGNTLHSIEEYTYDAAGRVKTKISRTDSNVGTKEEYAYNVLNDIAEKKVYSLESGTPLMYTETYTYSSSNISMTTTAEDGTEAAARSQSYTGMGLLKSTTLRDGNDTISTSCVYDDLDRKVSETDANGNITLYEYDCNNNVIKQTNAAGDSVTTKYDLAGRPIAVTDANGNTSYTEYDRAGRVIKSITPFDDNGDGETKTYYDKNSNVVKTAVKQSANEYRSEEYKYDIMGNLVAEIQNDGTSDLVTQYEYDSANRLTKRITGLSEYSETPEGGSATTYTYGNNGFLLKETNASNESIMYEHYDYVGNVKQAVEAYAWRYYTYGPYGLTKEYRHGRGETTKEYTYNDLGMLTGTKNSNVNLNEMPHLNGGEEVRTDTEESYTYDVFGRMVTHKTNDGRVQYYGYDNNSNLTSYRLNGNQSIAYEYNELNQLTKLTNNGIITTYEYDANGNLTKRSADNGMGTLYEYNNANLVTSVQNQKNGSNVSGSAYRYYLNGLKFYEVGAVATPGDLTLRNHYYDYDGAGRLIKDHVEKALEDVMYNQYTYDLRGNRTSSINMLSETGEKTEYEYDAGDHLLSEQTTDGGVLQSRTDYSYDERGNLSGERTRTYASEGLAGSTAEQAGLSNDANSVKTYHYDRFNRLVEYTDGDTVAKYEYNADNLRTAKTVNGRRTDYVWDGTNLRYETGGNGTHTYAYDPTGVHMMDGNYYVKDGHGNVTGMYDANAEFVSDTYYDAFGNITYGDAPNPFGYSGEYHDSETGLIYLRNRYYDSSTGRFITEDPAKDGVNWYSYCGGDPVNAVDPWGLKTNGYRSSEDLKFVNTQLMKIIANKAAYKKASIVGGDDAYKNNLSSWASNERTSLLNYVDYEFAGEGFAKLMNEVLSDGANVSIEDTSALLCVVAYYRSELDKNESDRDLSYDKLRSKFESAKEDNVLYYVNTSSEINVTEVIDNYFYPLNPSYDLSGNQKAYNNDTGQTVYARMAYPLDDQDDYQYAPDSP